jgi:hypothetical protein
MRKTFTIGILAVIASTPAYAGSYEFRIINNTGQIVTFYQSPACVNATCPSLPSSISAGGTFTATAAFTERAPVTDIFPTWYNCKNGICTTYKYKIELSSSNPSGTATCPAPAFATATPVSGPYGSAIVNGTGYQSPAQHYGDCVYSASFTLISQ